MSTIVGGQPAMAYFGSDEHGNDYALVVAHNDGSRSARGTYAARMSAPPSVFQRYVSGFNTVLRSFQFID